MPSINESIGKIEIAPNAYIFARKGIFALRVNLPQRKQFVRSLKINIEDGAEARKNAIAKARNLYDEISERLRADLPIRKLTILDLCGEFLKEGIEGLKVNTESGKDFARINGGRGIWTKASLSLFQTTINRMIIPFFGKKDLIDKDITQINQRDIDKWLAWRIQTFPKDAPSTFAKRNITMRHIFRLAQRKGERFTPPQIQDIPKEISKRRRPEISEDQYIELLGHVRAVYSKQRLDGSQIWGRDQKFAYLFYGWLETINHTGIRPWTTLKNAIKMEHISRDTDSNGNETLTLQRYEKSKAYVAVASPYWKRTLDRLEVFYKSFGITEDREYLFVHPETIGGMRIEKGRPIINFKRQWGTALKHLEWNEGKTEQSERISPYSIRHRYAGRRLINNEISAIELSQIMGTSLKMISDIYLHYSAKANYQRLTKGDLDANEEVDYFHPETGAREGSVKANGRLHQMFYNQNPRSIVKPDETITKAEMGKLLKSLSADEIKKIAFEGRD